MFEEELEPCLIHEAVFIKLIYQPEKVVKPRVLNDKETAQRCVDEYLTGKTMREVAKVVGVSQSYVGRVVKEAGVSRRQSEAMRLVRRRG